MNTAHLHLLLNHVPVTGVVFGCLLVAFALARRSSEVGKAALGLFALLGAAAVAVFATGGSAESLVERLPGFSEVLTERHEEAAAVATALMATFGAIALLALAVYRRRVLPRSVMFAALVIALGISGAMAYTANLGGQIRHSEIRSNATAGAAAEHGESGR